MVHATECMSRHFWYATPVEMSQVNRRLQRLLVIYVIYDKLVMPLITSHAIHVIRGHSFPLVCRTFMRVLIYRANETTAAFFATLAS